MKNIKVGELAEMTELSVRTLHHYDELGLLKPSQKTEAGHRLYTSEDVERLQKIISLKQLGFSLEEIKSTLDSKSPSLLNVIDQHISCLKSKIEQHQKILQRLSSAANKLRNNTVIQMDELLETIKEAVMFEKYYSEGQLQELKKREKKLSPGQFESVQKEWSTLIAKVRDSMKDGTDPLDPSVQLLAQRWMELVQMFTGGDAQISQATSNMYMQEPKYSQQMGLDPEIFEYIKKAKAGLKSN